MASAAPSEAESDASRGATETKLPPVDAPPSGDPPRLFILCGRERKVEELREMFARCGTIRQLHLATDRSNKSRGFAFLQYEDPSSATEAIRQFDKTTLSDGHVLKVTVAREKTRTTVATIAKPPQPGKLKRNQHSQDDDDDSGDHDGAADGSSFQGKRQRSSPPSSLVASSMVQKVWRRTSPFAPTLPVYQNAPEEEIKDILNGIVSQVEKMNQLDSTEKERIVSSGTLSGTPAAAKRKAPPGLGISVLDDGNTKESHHSATTKENGGDELAANKQKSQRMTAEQATPLRHPREHFGVHQRRRVTVDESDSSVDDASDASVGRRKRSNTEPDEADSEGVGASISRRRLSDLSELSLSPAGISSPLTSKKRCSRRSSGSSSSSLPPFHAAPFPPIGPMYPVLPPPPAATSNRRRRNTPHSKLFFTSTVKFTEQELEAMFSIYDQFESVQPVKSFGRVKTMAYVAYATAAAASLVLTSFLEDNEGEDHGMMKLVFADTEEHTTQVVHPPSSRRRQFMSTAGESTSSEIPTTQPTPIQADEHCWLMVLYDRTISNETISSCATSCEGMEYMDIKMFRSTGESQGVAFVKFESEYFAQAASRRLHNSEFPVGTRKFLQAIVIADPALFSTSHGTSASSSAEPTIRQENYSEDGDLGFVEARFAHLMSGPNEQHSSIAHHVPFDEAYDGPNQTYPRSGMFMELNPFVQGSNASPYGYFQFGQPYPYAASSSPHQSHPHSTHPPAFYHQGSFGPRPHTWGYEASYPSWSRESEYNQYMWDPTRHPQATQPDITSIFVSSSRPLDLSSLMKAIQECPGVVGFTKEEKDGVAFVVDFGEPGQAAEAVSKLDGTMCNGSKLRVAVASGNRPPPSRRKRQRLDQRGRRK